MPALNIIQLFGKVGKDPEVQATKGGTVVAKFSLATNEYAGKDSDGKAKYDTQWHVIKSFGKDADYIRDQLKKGDEVLVVGKLTYEKWEKDGVKHERAVIIAGMKGQVQRVTNRAAVADALAADATDDDDIPF